MPADRVYKCRVRPCQNVKGVNNHWFVVKIDADGRMVFEKFDNAAKFEKAARAHGANEVCSERCLHIHLSRWMQGRIDASNAPECGSPAFRTQHTLTAWVSSVYNTKTFSKGQLTEEKRPARIVNYRDNGKEQHMWCFNVAAFERIERSAGAHVRFKVRNRGDYSVIHDILEVLDGPNSSKGEKHVNTVNN